MFSSVNLEPPFPTLGSTRPQNIKHGVNNCTNTYTTKLVGSQSCLETHDWGCLKKRLGTTDLDHCSVSGKDMGIGNELHGEGMWFEEVS